MVIVNGICFGEDAPAGGFRNFNDDEAWMIQQFFDRMSFGPPVRNLDTVSNQSGETGYVEK
jgi:hypothetical protein